MTEGEKKTQLSRGPNYKMLEFCEREKNKKKKQPKNKMAAKTEAFISFESSNQPFYAPFVEQVSKSKMTKVTLMSTYKNTALKEGLLLPCLVFDCL